MLEWGVGGEDEFGVEVEFAEEREGGDGLVGVVSVAVGEGGFGFGESVEREFEEGGAGVGDGLVEEGVDGGESLVEWEFADGGGGFPDARSGDAALGDGLRESCEVLLQEVAEMRMAGAKAMVGG